MDPFEALENQLVKNEVGGRMNTPLSSQHNHKKALNHPPTQNHHSPESNPSVHSFLQRQDSPTARTNGQHDDFIGGQFNKRTKSNKQHSHANKKKTSDRSNSDYERSRSPLAEEAHDDYFYITQQEQEPLLKDIKKGHIREKAMGRELEKSRKRIKATRSQPHTIPLPRRFHQQYQPHKNWWGTRLHGGNLDHQSARTFSPSGRGTDSRRSMPSPQESLWKENELANLCAPSPLSTKSDSPINNITPVVKIERRFEPSELTALATSLQNNGQGNNHINRPVIQPEGAFNPSAIHAKALDAPMPTQTEPVAIKDEVAPYSDDDDDDDPIVNIMSQSCEDCSLLSDVQQQRRPIQKGPFTKHLARIRDNIQNGSFTARLETVSNVPRLESFEETRTPKRQKCQPRYITVELLGEPISQETHKVWLCCQATNYQKKAWLLMASNACLSSSLKHVRLYNPIQLKVPGQQSDIQHMLICAQLFEPIHDDNIDRDGGS